MNEDKLYYDYLKVLNKTEEGRWKFYDQALLSISAGAIVLSVTFLSKVVTDKELINGSLLVYSWYSWVFCIFFLLMSYGAGIKGIRKTRQQWEDGQREDLGKPWNTIVMVLNIISIIPFLSGMALLTMFASTNILK